MRALLRWLLPGGVVASAVAAALFFAPGGDAFVEMVTRRYSVLAYVVAAGLAVAFHRSRVLALVAALAAFEAAARYALVPPEVTPALAVGMVVLLGMGAIARDRVITSGAGLAQLAVALGLAGIWTASMARAPDAAAALVPTVVTDAAGGPAGPWFAESMVVLLVLVAGAALVGWMAYRRGGAVERGVVWALALTAGWMLAGVEGPTASLLRMGATLALGLAVLETSYAMAYRDELTNLPGRRSLMRDLEGLTGTYTLAMVDVDHFKQFNDKHGHDVGDQVLRLVASRLDRAPAGGRAYRYGGEEFTILYRGLGREEAAPLLESVRRSVAEARFSLRGRNRPTKKDAGKAKRGKGRRTGSPKSLSVTVSIGLADGSGSAAKPEDVLDRADKALYRAKRAGRDRISA